MIRPAIAIIVICSAQGASPVSAARAPAASVPVASVEVPIREVDLSDGTRRYSVTIELDGHSVDAGLDTGSVGLRVLPGVVDTASIVPVGPVQRYGYGVGTTLEGPVVRSTISVGALRGTARWQAVRTIGCSAERPDCPAAHVDPTKFGIQGNGHPGEGFRAILGVGLARAALPNPFREIGVSRWIVELPRPGDAATGRLILNPSDEQVAGFMPLPLADAHLDRANDAVRGCLLHTGGKPICASTIIDSGAPGIELVNRRADADWTEGTAARLTFGESPDIATVGVGFTVGRRAQASRFTVVNDPRVDGVRIRSGLITYFAYDVLYDADHGSIAIRARPAYLDGVIAIGAGHAH